MKPTLKKVSKYENKFAKLQKKAAEFNFRNQLKQVKKKEFTLEEEDKEVRTIVFDKIFASTSDVNLFLQKCFFFPIRQRSKSFLHCSSLIIIVLILMVVENVLTTSRFKKMDFSVFVENF